MVQRDQHQRHHHPEQLSQGRALYLAGKEPVQLSMHFSARPIPIPNSPNTFMKLFLPADTMSLNKQSFYNYGLTKLASLNKPTSFKRTIAPGKDCLFYVAAYFYQTNTNARDEPRGGNRAELIVKGQDLYYSMLPQVDAVFCGRIITRK